MEFFILCDITCQKIATQENCKQDRNSLAKSVQKEKKCSKNCLSQIFCDQFYDSIILCEKK